jgi:hypothetical protein
VTALGAALLAGAFAAYAVLAARLEQMWISADHVRGGWVRARAERFRPGVHERRERARAGPHRAHARHPALRRRLHGEIPRGPGRRPAPRTSAGDRPAAHDRARYRGRGAVARGAMGTGRVDRHDSGADGRGAGSRGGDRPRGPHSYPTGAERGERAQRRDRDAARHAFSHDRGHRGGRRGWVVGRRCLEGAGLRGDGGDRRGGRGGPGVRRCSSSRLDLTRLGQPRGPLASVAFVRGIRRDRRERVRGGVLRGTDLRGRLGVGLAIGRRQGFSGPSSSRRRWGCSRPSSSGRCSEPCSWGRC